MKIIKTYKIFESYNKFGTKSLTESEFDKIRKENCKNWISANTEIFRSMPDLGDYLYIDPLKGEFRTSIEKTNLHIDLLSNLPSWKEYPKYERCVIGITSMKRADYGDSVYEVIPFDGVKIAVCPEETIWESLGKGNYGWGEDIYLVSEILDSLDLTADWNGMENLLKLGKIPKIDRRFLIEYNIKTGKDINEITGKDCFDFINDHLFNPVKRKFKLLNYDSGFKTDNEKQIWTEGPCLLIKSNLV
jgi:hypothetical protein